MFFSSIDKTFRVFQNECCLQCSFQNSAAKFDDSQVKLSKYLMSAFTFIDCYVSWTSLTEGKCASKVIIKITIIIDSTNTGYEDNEYKYLYSLHFYIQHLVQTGENCSSPSPSLQAT